MISARVRGLLLLMLVFVAGGVIGFALGHGSRAATAQSNPMEPHAFARRMATELDLSPTQRDSVVAILTRRQAGIDSAWRVLSPGVRATIDSAQREIIGVLRPDQRPKYLELTRAAHGGMGAR